MPDPASIREVLTDLLGIAEDAGGDSRELADAVITALRADPVGTMRLLGDVREGTLIDFKPVPYDPDPGWVVEPPGDIHEREGHHAGVSVFVVRPRGEATDA